MRSSPKPMRRDLLAAIVLTACIGSPAAIPPLSADDRPAGTGVHSLENATFYFRAKDGSVLTLLMLELLNPRDGADRAQQGELHPAYEGAASVVESGRRGDELPGAPVRAVPLEIAPGAAHAGRATFFGRVYLQSGHNYSVRYVVNDEARDEIFVRNALLTVPYLNGGFSASSVVPAEQFGPAVSGHGIFQVGSEEVVPKPGGIFRRSDLLRLYLQVYDAVLDHETMTRRVDVEFRFYRAVNGSSKRYGKPFSVRGAAGPSMGLALPIGDWPAGPYRVVVDLHDRIAASRTTTEGTFSIIDE
jgi:hypothetical protein